MYLYLVQCQPHLEASLCLSQSSHQASILFLLHLSDPDKFFLHLVSEMLLLWRDFQRQSLTYLQNLLKPVGLGSDQHHTMPCILESGLIKKTQVASISSKYVIINHLQLHKVYYSYSFGLKQLELDMNLDHNYQVIILDITLFTHNFQNQLN